MAIGEIFNQFSNISKIKLHGGLVGKVSMVLISLTLALSGVAIALKDKTIAIIIICGLLPTVAVFLWKIISFAGKHPDVALLEGAEFLAHEQILYGTKEHPTLTESSNQEAHVKIDDKNREIAALPDFEIIRNEE